MARPRVELDRAEIQKLAFEGAFNTEIAEYFGVDRDTIADNYSAELTKGRLERKMKLRRSQFRAAEQGNPTMLIWLGKQYLGQSDRTIDEYLLEAIKEAGLSKDDLLGLVKRKDMLQATAPLRTFEEFCSKAGYPTPYPKQLEMRTFAVDGTGACLLLGSRGYGKTDYITILGVAYDIYLNRTTSWLIVTKSRARNAAIIEEIAKALMQNGVTLEKQNSTCVRVNGLAGKDHSVEAITVKSSARGRHPKKILMDDPVTDEDTSEAVRLQVQRKYNELFKLCSNITILGQPAHAQDLYAKLRPLLSRKMEVPYGTIPELDHDLEAQRLAGVDEKSIQASYFLKIVSDGQAPFEKINYLDRMPGGETVAFLDPSHKGKDTSALTIMRQHFQGVAVVGFAAHRAWNHWLDDIVPKLIKFGVKKLCVECNGLGDQPVIMLRQLLKDKGIGVVGMDSTDNKHARIMAAGAFAHLIHLSKESDRAYTDQVIQYEYGASFDDAPDSLATCLKWLGLIRGKA